MHNQIPNIHLIYFTYHKVVLEGIRYVVQAIAVARVGLDHLAVSPVLAIAPRLDLLVLFRRYVYVVAAAVVATAVAAAAVAAAVVDAAAAVAALSCSRKEKKKKNRQREKMGWQHNDRES